MMVSDFRSLKISVIGAGNGGQAIAGYCASLGMSVCLYNRNIEKIAPILQTHTIELQGTIFCKGYIDVITSSLETAATYSDILMIATTATAHREIASKMCPYLKNGQIIVLNPGRTLGVLDFYSVINAMRPDLEVFIAEAQTLMFACRETEPGKVNIIGLKDKVLLSGRSHVETEFVIRHLSPFFPFFIPASNLIQTSLENIGSIFHPSVVFFNEATIERNIPFYFYRDMTPKIASFIEKLDKERIEVGEAFGQKLMPVSDWIVYAYPSTVGNTLCERMKNNPAYYDILAPGSIFTRQLTEDIPTGLIPMSDLGKAVGVKTPLMDSIITITSSLLNIDFRQKGRTLLNLHLDRLNKEQIIDYLS